jgi:hypothetical protein
VFIRMVAYGLVISAIDAVAGRLLQADPDPSVVLSLGATAWAAYQLAAHGRERIAFAAGVTLWLAFMGGFLLWARLLVGWNGSVPWHPRSTTWMTMFAIAVPVAAIAAQLLGGRAASRATSKVTGDSTHPA